MSSKGIAGFNTGLVKSVAGGYTPTEWATGDVITADKLNKMEGGIEDISSQTLIVEASLVDYSVVLNKTWQEIKEHVDSGCPVFCYRKVNSSLTQIYNIAQVYISESNTYIVNAIDAAAGSGIMSFYAGAPDGYPSVSD